MTEEEGTMSKLELRRRDLAPALAAVAVFGCAVWFGGCSDDGGDTFIIGGSTTPVQIERLARPVVNEGLVISNVFLNTFNSIPPSQDLPTFTGTPAFAAEVTAVLDAVDSLDGDDDVDPNDVVNAFLPDVMRIDTSLNVPYPDDDPTLATYVAAYSFGALPVGTVVRPIAGRKLEDDVVDITLSVLAGGPVSDNVDYRDDDLTDGPCQRDHDLLEGQTVAGGTAVFPFLAPAN
jgi:hypothetical protein